MNRRYFIGAAPCLGASLFLGFGGRYSSGGQPRVRMLTSAPGNHFFGYYGINPWNSDKSCLLSLEAPFNDRLPKPGEKASIGIVSMRDGSFSKIGETSAWNLQQGCMLHWNPVKPSEEFYYNDLVDGKLVSVLYNLRTGGRTVIPDTISGLSHDGKYALHMNYGRISRLRKVVSYSGSQDPHPNTAHPEDDGVFVLDLHTRKKKLIVPYSHIAKAVMSYSPGIRDRHIWIEHAEFSRDDSRFLFLPRTWNSDHSKLETGLYTIGTGGEEMRKVIPYGSSVSHFGWRNDREMAATFNYCDDRRCHVLFSDTEYEENRFRKAGNLDWDGHCSFSRDGEWLLTDGNKDMVKFENSVWLYNMSSGEQRKLATMKMLAKRFLTGDSRCDLHPRWSDDNKMVCVDAIDVRTGTRQIFIIETGL